MNRHLRDLIPAVIVLVFIAAMLGLVFEVMLAAARGNAVDSGATSAFGVVITACVPALIALYIRDSTAAPSEEETDGGDSAP